MTLDPAGLEAAAKLARSCTPTAREDARLAEQIVRAYLAAAPDTGRSVLMHVPVTPTTENPPENVYARLRNRPPEPSAAVAWDEGYVAGFAAGRAAATPGPRCGNCGHVSFLAAATHPAAASPDERLREALAEIARPSWFGATALREIAVAALAAADREKPDEPHTQDCQDAMFMHHAATGGDMECTCIPPVVSDGVMVRVLPMNEGEARHE